MVAWSSFPCFFGRSNHCEYKPLLTFSSFSIKRSWTSLLYSTDETLLRINILREVWKELERIVDLEQSSSSHLMIALGFLQISSANFLTNATNKRNLNKYLANKFLAYYEGKQSILCVTFGDSIISKWINFVRNWNKPMQQWRDRSKDWCYKSQKERIYQCTSKKQLIVT